MLIEWERESYLHIIYFKMEKISSKYHYIILFCNGQLRKICTIIVFVLSISLSVFFFSLGIVLLSKKILKMKMSQLKIAVNKIKKCKTVFVLQLQIIVVKKRAKRKNSCVYTYKTTNFDYLLIHPKMEAKKFRQFLMQKQLKKQCLQNNLSLKELQNSIIE